MPSPAYRLTLVAVGNFDAAVALTQGLCIWDIADGHALLRGAGLTLSNRKGRAIQHDGRTFHGCIGGAPDLVQSLAGLALKGPRDRNCRVAANVRPVAATSQSSRAQGCLLGQHAGDALGSAAEFQSACDIKRTHPNGVTQLSDGGTWNLIAGQPTDDSEMALALARSILDVGTFDHKDVCRA